MKDHEPCQKPQKAPPARKPIAKQDDAGPRGQLIADRHRPWQGRGQQDEGGCRPGQRPAYDPEAPNANPVEAGPAVAPKDENGKIDVTKIADANDFGDWEEQGCKG